MTEREWILKLQTARVALYHALQAEEAAERVFREARQERDKVLAACNEVREAFDAWLLEQAGVA